MIAHKYFNSTWKMHNLPKLIFAVVRTQKCVELLSFLYWEVLYFLGGYHNRTIKFDMNMLDGAVNRDLFVLPKFFSHCNRDFHILFRKGELLLYSKSSKKNCLYLQNGDKPPVLINVFSDEIVSIYMSSKKNVFVCLKGKVLRAESISASFDEVLCFSDRASFVWHNNTMTENELGHLFVGEYVSIFNGKWQFAAYLYYSIDGGIIWDRSDFLKNAGVNKHVHLVKWSSVLKGLILTDGDNLKKMWFTSSDKYKQICKKGTNGWVDKSKRHVCKGGYTGFAETADKVFLGSDYMGGTNFIVSTTDLQNYCCKVVPDPYRRGIIRNIVSLKRNGLYQIWLNIHCSFSSKVKSAIVCSLDNGNTWKLAVSYNGMKVDFSILNNSSSDFENLYLKCCAEGKNSVFAVPLDHVC